MRGEVPLTCFSLVWNRFLLFLLFQLFHLEGHFPPLDVSQSLTSMPSSVRERLRKHGAIDSNGYPKVRFRLAGQLISGMI